jgi:NAD(P)-dependent dehydrogenase (short-subunit alcohol dehydrogenase family)
MKGFARTVLCLVVLYGGLIWLPASADESAQKAVLVTGASSGIGLSITEHLAAEGHFVYAGARKAEDIARLSAMDNVKGIRLDVTVQEEIDAALELVRGEGRGLYGIVNNAGVNVIGPLIELDEGELDFLFDVNVYGPYRINKAFAPMIIESKGRISNISSISGVLTGPLYGIYAMSKHALEAYTDALAIEMGMLGVKVSAVEPGNYKSKIGDTRCERLLNQEVDPQASYWADYIKRVVDNCENRPENTAPEPDDVARAVLSALFDDDPKEHYMVVPEQFQAEITIRKAIEELVRYNEDHEFSYSKEELVEMLEDEFDTGDAFIRSVSAPQQ